MNIIGWSLILLVQVEFTSGETCPTSECTCIRDVIECTHKNLTHVPTFSRVENRYVTIKLSFNALTQLPANAFLNLNVENIELDHNLLTHIDPNAFHGLENRLTYLNLKDNKLTTAPAVLKKTRSLKSLNLIGNPIPASGFKDDVFYALGTNLTELHFGDDNLRQWPSSLHHLQTLFTLYFQSSSTSVMPYQAFRGFELTLNKLSISKTSLFQVPLAVSRLANLKEFIFDDNPKTGDVGMTRASFHNLPIVSLSLKNDSLTTIPSIISELTRLSSLYVDRNSFWYIDEEAIYNVNSKITKLSLSQCKLDRIPQSLMRIIFLEQLDLSYNNINSIYTNDLVNNTNIHNISLAHNPLKYISSSALFSIPNLRVLDMSNTLLKSVPKAVLNLRSAVTVNLEHCLIECTCDLTWIMSHNISVLGECDTITQSIQNYVNYRLPTC